MAATLDNFFGKKDDLRVPYGRGEKPDSEKSVDVRSEERLMSKSPLPGENKLKAAKLCTGDGMKDLKNPGDGDPETKSKISGLFANSKENMDKDRASVKVYTRRVGQDVFWDTKLQRDRTWEELARDPEIRDELRGYKMFLVLRESEMESEMDLRMMAHSGNLRINADNCWDTMELEHPATFEELGMDPENKGIISDFFGFVRAIELCKRIDQASKKDNCLVYDSPGTGRSSIIAAMANYLKFYIYHLDLSSFRARRWLHSMELERPPTFAEGIISDLLRFVRGKELYKRMSKDWKRGYLLYDSPGTDRSSLIAAMASYLKFDIYDLDLMRLSSIDELLYVLMSINNRSLIAIKDFDHWFGMHPNLKNEVESFATKNEGFSFGGERLAEVISLMEVKLASRLQFLRISWLARSSLRPLAFSHGSEIERHIAFSSSEFAATNNRAHPGRQGNGQRGSSGSHPERERIGETPNKEGIASDGISFEHLQQHFGSKREVAARSLGISVSTLKRACRSHGIKRWPNQARRVLRSPDPHGENNPSRTYRTLSTIGQIMVPNEMGGQNPEPNEFQTFVDLSFSTESGSIAGIPIDGDWAEILANSIEGNVSGSLNLTVAACSNPATSQQPMPTCQQPMPTCFDPALSQPPMPTIPNPMPTIHMMSDVAAREDTRSVQLKITYRKDMLKFKFPLMSGIIKLKEEVKKRLQYLELDSFDVKYIDDEGDRILLNCDEDLREYLQLSSNQAICRLLVVDRDANTTSLS